MGDHEQMHQRRRGPGQRWLLVRLFVAFAIVLALTPTFGASWAAAQEAGTPTSDTAPAADAAAVAATDTPTPEIVPTDVPTAIPTEVPPTAAPTDVPTDAPTAVPTDTPAEIVTIMPTTASTDTPTPTDTPTKSPNAAVAAITGTPFIVSDQADYPPGGLVTLTGGNWQPGETVHIFVNDDEGQSWSRNVDVTANANGTLTDSFNLPNRFVANYTVKATGSVSGPVTTSFTDANGTASFTGSDNAAHSTLGAEENLGSAVGQTANGIALSCPRGSGLTVSGSGLGNGNGHWNLGYAAASGDNATLSPISSLSPASGDFGNGSGSSCVALVINTISLAPGVYHGRLILSLPDFTPVSTAEYFFKFTIASACTAASIATQPSAQSATYGNNAVFTAAGGGNPTPTVQWQVSTNSGGSWTNISGATSATLTLTVPSVAMSGNQYRAVFTNTCSGTQSATTNAVALTVSKKTVTGNFTANDKVYDGTMAATIATRTLTGVVGADDASLSGGTATFANKNVGTAKVVSGTGFTLSGATAGNYTLSSTSLATSANITALGLTITGAVANGKPYDGATTAAVNFGGATLAGVISPEVVSINSASYAATFSDKNAGAGKAVTVTGVAIGGTDGGNYTVAQPTGLTATIAVKTLTGAFTASSKVYDGTTAATVLTRTLPGAIAGDMVSLTGGTATFADKNAGAAKTVTLTGATLTGLDAGNYQLTSVGPTTADITTRPITVTADAKTKQFGAVDPALTFQTTTGSLASGDSYTGALTRVAGESVAGSPYAIQQGTLSAGTNYALTYAGANFTITSRPATVAATNASVTVNEGQSAANTGTFSDPGIPVTLSASSGVIVQNNANGTWSWSFATTDGPSQSQIVTITAADTDGPVTTTFTLTVVNVTPVVTAPVAAQTATAGVSSSFNLGSFVDPGADSPWTVNVNWGDASTPTTFTQTTTGPITAQSHTYAAGGAFTISVTVKDKDNATSSPATTFSVTINRSISLTLSTSSVDLGNFFPFGGSGGNNYQYPAVVTATVTSSNAGWTGQCSASAATGSSGIPVSALAWKVTGGDGSQTTVFTNFSTSAVNCFSSSPVGTTTYAYDYQLHVNWLDNPGGFSTVITFQVTG